METMGDKIRRLARKSYSREGGFTLIEVIVAVAIVSLIAVGIYSALSASVTSSVNEEERGTARNLAEAMLEWAKGLKLDPACIDCIGEETDLPEEYDPYSGKGGTDEALEILSQYPGYEVEIGVSKYSENRDAFQQLITVRVYFEDEEVLVLEGMKLISDNTFAPLPGAGYNWDCNCEL